ncbi:MAG: DUF2721 domain-containing protein [Chloroflexi bacterium]|nr:DUF2721 domain-containing protein [Chloroflexota bacterium]
MDISWVMPILILPGVALLIVSTSARYGQVHDEMHHILHDMEHLPKRIASHLIRRARLFRNALVALYISVGVFALASALGAVMIAMSLEQLSATIVAAGVAIGVCHLLFAAVELIQESMLSLEVIELHFEEIDMGWLVEEAEGNQAFLHKMNQQHKEEPDV